MHLNNFNKKFDSGRKDWRAGKSCGGDVWREDFIKDEKP